MKALMFPSHIQLAREREADLIYLGMKPWGVTTDEAIFKELRPVFMADETCLMYSAPSCMYIALRWENVLFSFLLGITRTFLTELARIPVNNLHNTVIHKLKRTLLLSELQKSVDDEIQTSLQLK